ncbi:14-3-3 domain-containing protein [Lactifluus volemus]|nr:14-3-3 domain-containing protein [Lactifluus volemus]
MPLSLFCADCLVLAKLAGQAERWDDVIKQLKSIISYSDGHLTMEERNLLSIAYKHVMGTLLTSWRNIEGIEKQETVNGCVTQRKQALIRHQREKIENELADACRDLLNLLDRSLVPVVEPGEERVFNYKMHETICRVRPTSRPRTISTTSIRAHKALYKHAFNTLPPWHPTRLGVALNFFVHFHDVHGSPDRACHLTNHAFDEVVGAMHATPEHTFRDSLMILQFLRDDIILWSAEMLQDGAYQYL